MEGERGRNGGREREARREREIVWDVIYRGTQYLG